MTQRWMIVKTLVFLLALASSGCCFIYQKCAEDSNDASFTIVSGKTGEDLLFGAKRKYIADSTKLFSILLGDTTFHYFQVGLNRNLDSSLNANFGFQPIDTLYLQLSDGDIDTLSIIYKDNNSRCCPTTTLLFESFNSQPLERKNGTFILAK